MTSLVSTLTETLRYRGAVGQWSWVLHRLTGLGVVFFLVLHVIDTSWAVFYPALYVEAIAIYQTPLFTIGEFGLVAAVVYHAYNGVRISLIDFRPKWWKYQRQAALYVVLATVLTLIPAFIMMFGHVLDYYNSEPSVLPLDFVLIKQLPFAAGIVLAFIVAIIVSFAYGAVTGVDKRAEASTGPRRQSRLERFWWSYMRVSGLLIVPLVFGHLAIMHLIQGVFALSEPATSIAGTTAMNTSGTAVEFVAQRWNMLIAGVAVWRLYDFALLALTVIHGFNGLRYVLTDYTANNPALRRAMTYVCVIGATILLVLGGLALVGTIDSSAIEIATEAAAELHAE